MITAQKEARKKVGEICPTLLKVFLNPGDMETGLISAGQALLSVQRAVLYENNGHKLISMSPYIIELLPQIHAAASKADCILITGDTGTGKDLLASYISRHGRTEKMIPVNCAAIPEMLFESEFFGHDKGAFTGAVNKHRGLLEQARGGFLFLDEIGELSLNLQAKFLRILEGSSFERVGGNKPLQPHVRYIASTNQDLSKIVKQGRFRNDLLFRLNQVHFHLPPLDQRKEDIPLLAHYFLWQYNGQYGKDCRLGESYMAMLQQYPWTGHIRELANLIHQDVLSAKDGDVIEKMVSFHEEAGAPTHLVDQVQEYERKLIIEALELCGSQRAAANHLNLPLSTLHSKIKKYGLVIV
jgi:transcriptional regulator with PAS, ATPase and Fis domain